MTAIAPEGGRCAVTLCKPFAFRLEPATKAAGGAHRVEAGAATQHVRAAGVRRGEGEVELEEQKAHAVRAQHGLQCRVEALPYAVLRPGGELRHRPNRPCTLTRF
eukprot:1065947-Pyramimonas_sp.AAC.1